MKFRHHKNSDLQAIAQLFSLTFADSEGKEEGEVIGQLAIDLFEMTDERDLFNFVAESEGQIVGSIFFTRLRFENEPQVFMLAPVAVRSDKQGNGIGQALIRHGLKTLQEEENVRAVITYGDPRFYGKVGFGALPSETAPYDLSQPEGWLGQSLVDGSLETLSGKSMCVEAFRKPAYW